MGQPPTCMLAAIPGTSNIAAESPAFEQDQQPAQSHRPPFDFCDAGPSLDISSFLDPINVDNQTVPESNRAQSR